MPVDPLWERTLQEYPALSNLGLHFTYTPKEKAGYLEWWPSGEPGTTKNPRPSTIPLQGMGVEVYAPSTRPIDIAGDVVSHHLVNTDPRFKDIYTQFEQSLQPWQRDILKKQYQYAVKNEEETRPYEQWYGASGLPGYFRGYPFQQWDDPSYYSYDQRRLLDTIIPLLQQSVRTPHAGH